MKRHLGAFLPAFLCVALFGATVFWLVLPETEQAILAKKREMIRELTHSVISLLGSYEQQVGTGLLSRQEAQERAMARIRNMRYGEDEKNYFWLIDLADQTMLMHPYANQLVGKYLIDETDSKGVRFFQAMLEVLEQQGAGFVSYHFQYLDDPTRDALKISYVARFTPWNWGVGTGIYTKDVHEELARFSKELTWAGLGVWLIVTMLGAYISLRNIRVDRQNQAAQQALRESAQKFRSVSANALDGIVMINSQQEVTFWNQAAQEIFGYADSEVLGRNALELLTPQRLHQQYLATFRKLLAQDQGLVLGNLLELVAVDRLGREFPVEVSVSALSMSGQWHVVCVVRNITKRKQAERALAESEKLYRTMVDQAGDAIFLIEDNRFIDCNQAALRMFWANRQQVIGHSPADLSPPSQSGGQDSAALAREKVAQALEVGHPIFFEWTHQRQDGSPFEAEVSLIKIKLSERNCLLAVVRDVSQRKQDEAALKLSEWRLRLAQAVGGVGSYEIDLATGLVWGSEEAAKIYGVDGNDAEIAPFEFFKSLAQPGDRARLDQAFELLLTQNVPYEQEYVIHRYADGAPRHVLSKAEVVRDEKGQPQKVLGIIQDITERKQAEEALRESEWRLLQAQTVGGVGSYEIDLATGLVWGSEQAAKIYGFAYVEQMKFERVQALSLPSERTRLDQALQDLLEHNAPYEQEYTIKRASDGQPRRLVSRAEVLRDDGGRPLKIVGTVQDITERKQAEEQIAKSEAALRGILKASPSGIAMIDYAERKMIWANQSMADITGYTLDEILGMPTRQLYFDDEEFERVGQLTRRGIRDHGVSSFQTRVRTKDGRALDILIHVAPLVPEDPKQGLVFTALNVSERVRAENEVRKSEATLASILKASPSGIAMTSYTDRRLDWANQRLAEITGYPLDELLGMPTRQLYFDDHEYNTVRRRALKEIKSRGVSSFQTLWRSQSGRALDILLNISAVDPDKFEEGIVFTALDISERARAEQEIRRSETTMRTILKASPSGLAQVSYPQRRIVWASERLCQMTGYPIQKILGMCTKDLYLSQEAFDLAGQRVPGQIAMGGAASFETQWRRRDGSLMDVLINVSALNPQDLSAGQVTSVLDVTDSKHAREQARRSEEKYRLILEATPDPVVLYDMQGQVVYLNPAFTRVFGWTMEEMAGRRVDYVPAEEQAKTNEMIALMLQGEVGGDFETRRFNRQGEVLNVSMSWSVWRDEQGALAGSVVMLRDVTEQRKLVAQLEQARKMEAVGTLAGGIAHDFNNVLQAISGNVQLLMMRRDLDGGTQDTLAGISNLTQRAAEMVQQLLTISRKREVRLEAVPLNQEVQQICRLLERIIPKMITLELQLAPDLLPINGDRGQLEQILLNLASNAVDAMPQGGKLTFQTQNLEIDEVFCRTHPELSPGPHVLLRAVDTGQGIDKETQKHIFEPFYTTKQKGKGTGLGLSTIYGIVTSHMGLITCYSELDEGTVFTIYFPALSGTGASQLAAGAGPEAELRGGGETILLVDDEADIRKVGSEILGMFGYQVLVAGSGEEALAIYDKRAGSIDLVILDINMPGMGGHRCLENLLRLDPAAGVIISSGYYTQLTANELTAAGARGFIGKPYRLTDMVRRVREVLDGKPTR